MKTIQEVTHYTKQLNEKQNKTKEEKATLRRLMFVIASLGVLNTCTETSNTMVAKSYVKDDIVSTIDNLFITCMLDLTQAFCETSTDEVYKELGNLDFDSVLYRLREDKELSYKLYSDFCMFFVEELFGGSLFVGDYFAVETSIEV